jgi:hypothetical protein
LQVADVTPKFAVHEKSDVFLDLSTFAPGKRSLSLPQMIKQNNKLKMRNIGQIQPGKIRRI